MDQEFKRYNSYHMSLLDYFAPLKRRQVKAKVNPWYTSDLAILRKSRNKLRIIADRENSEVARIIGTLEINII